MAISLRERAFDVFKFYAESGHPITLKDLAAQSEDLLGRRVPYNTILDWVDKDDWNGRVKISFDGSKELSQVKILLDIAYDGIMAKIGDDTKPSDVAASCTMFRRMVTKIPRSLWPVVEMQVVKVRARVFSLCEDYKDIWPRTNVSTMAGVWTDLERYVMPELPVEDGAVYDLDDVVMKEMDA